MFFIEGTGFIFHGISLCFVMDLTSLIPFSACFAVHPVLDVVSLYN